jgi:hypothetical protein
LEFEGDALYLHREDFERSLLGNSLWFSAPDDFSEVSSRYTDQYCLVEARFLASDRGHHGLFRGSLYHVERVLVLPGREAFETEDWTRIVEWRRKH